ncbi:MAG TPA: DUF2252 domain-containing protein [Anaerolineaceae bacterium]|nr:DUF2252 domain-containing protein [Anaerolineaceae bacterium]
MATTFLTNSTTRAERYAAGKALRIKIPRSSHSTWSASTNRPDPISLLEESNRSRLASLVPIRYGRMALSPFAFLRGSAVIMASDLSTTPVMGIHVQSCGDAHLSNFGIYATPERKLVFDLNDFDETLPGPWEWDVKRLAASVILVGRQNGFTPEENRLAVLALVQSYRLNMREFMTRTHLNIWYTAIDLQNIMESVGDKQQKLVRKAAEHSQRHTSTQIFPKLTKLVDGQYRIKDEPPLIEHYHDNVTLEELWASYDAYVATLPEERLVLLNRYHPIDLAQKVVGVGSVGTVCAIVLLMGDNDFEDPLFLQIKEAQASVLEPYVSASAYPNHAQRVVIGQRLMQASSDIFLGWSKLGSRDFYIRQLRDMKLSVEVERMDQKTFVKYIRVCGAALARAHARSGDSAQISGYLGSSDAFDQAIASFAEAYADQTERDHSDLIAAIKGGRVQAENVV